MEVLRKLYEYLLLSTLAKYNKPLSVERGGFRSKRGTLDQDVTLQEWICQGYYIGHGLWDGLIL